MADELVFRLVLEDNATAPLGAFQRQLRDMESNGRQASSELSKAFANVGGMISNFAIDTGKKLVAFGKDSVKAFMDFEDAMVAVAKTTGIPKEQIGKLGEQVRQTAVDMKGLGEGAAVQIANIVEIAGQLGIASGKIGKGQFDDANAELLQFAETIAKGKIALPEFSGGVEQIATVIAKQIALYGATSAEAERYLSIMNKLADTTAATAVEISSFISKFTLAPTLKITYEESAALAAAFVSLGQNASDAATRLQSGYAMILKGSKDTNSAINALFQDNKRAAEELQQFVGRTGTDFSNMAREAIGKDATGALKLFVTTLSEVESASERSELAFKMFGQVGARAIMTLIPELPKISDASREMATAFLVNNETAIKSLEELSGISSAKFGDIGKYIETVFKKDSPDAIRVLIAELDKIQDPIEKSQQASMIFGENWEQVMNRAKGGIELFDQALITARQETQAVADGASSIEKEYQTALDKTRTSFSELTAVIEDLKLQFGAPLAEAAANTLKLIIPLFEELRVNGVELVNLFGEGLGLPALGTAAAGVFEAITGSLDELANHSGTFKEALAEAFTVENILSSSLNAIQNFGTGVISIFESVFGVSIVTDFFDSIIAAYNEIAQLNWAEAFAAIGIAIAQAFVDFQAAIVGMIAEVAGVGEEFDALKSYIDNVFTEISAIAQTAIQGLSEDAKKFVADWQTGLDLLEQLISSTWTTINATVSDVLNTIKAEVIAAIEQIETAFQRIPEAFNRTVAAVKNQSQVAADAVLKNEQLTGVFEKLTDKIYGVEDAFEGHSLTPALARYAQAAVQGTSVTGEMSAELQQTAAQVLQADQAYQQLESQMHALRKQEVAVNADLQQTRAARKAASDEAKTGYDAEIQALERKKRAITAEKAEIKEKQYFLKEAIDLGAEDLRMSQQAAEEAERAAKRRADANERLFKDAQRNEELLVKAAAERDKAESAAFMARKKEADESVQWITKLDDATQKRLFAEGDALKVLQEQGVVLDDLQQTAVWRLQKEYETEQALQAQTAALQAQLDPMGAMLAASEKLSGNLGNLSSGIGKIGDLFGFDTSGIEKFLGKAQGLAQLPQTIKGITDSIGGIGQALGGLGNIGSSIGGIFQSLGGLLGGGAGGGGLGGIISGITSALGGGGAGGGGLGGILQGLTGQLQGLGSTGPLAIAAIGSAAIAAASEMLGLSDGASKVAQAFGILPGILTDVIGKLFESESAGTKAANAFQDFVSKNIAGGAEMSAALKTNFDAMGQANFDFQTFLTQTGTTMDQTFGGISANWQQGTTAMDLFTQAVVKSGVEESKAAQVSLQMMASFQDMGMSADEAGAKMLEIAKASGMDTNQLKQLEAALGQAGSEMAQTGAQSEGLSTDLTGLTDEERRVAEQAKQTSDSLTGLTDEERLAAEQAKVAAEGLTTLTGAEQTAAGGALGASSDTSQFADALQQLHSEGQITKGELDALGATFGGAGGDSLGAANDIESLKSSLSDLGVSGKDADEMVKAFTLSLEKIPAKKEVVVSVKTEGTIPEMATGGIASGLAVVNERGSEIAKFPSGAMALMTAPGPVIGAFPTGTQIIPHHQSMAILRQSPDLPRMATGGRVAVKKKSKTKKVDPISRAAANQTIAALTALFEGEAEAVEMTVKQHSALAKSLRQIGKDGRVTQREIAKFGGILAATGVPLQTLVNHLAQVQTNFFQTANGALQAKMDVEKLPAGLQTLNTALTEQRAAADATLAPLREQVALQRLQAEQAMIPVDAKRQELELQKQLSLQTLDPLRKQVEEAKILYEQSQIQKNLDAERVKLQQELLAYQTGNSELLAGLLAVVPAAATGGVVSGLALVNERGSEIAKFPSGLMALLTQPGPILGAFPSGTEIIPHAESMRIMARQPNLPRMATGGVISANAPVINITISGNTISNALDMRNLAKQVSAEISKSYRAMR